jgi:hypothetical protein
MGANVAPLIRVAFAAIGATRRDDGESVESGVAIEIVRQEEQVIMLA